VTDKKFLDEYVDVASRLKEVYERFPDGRLVTERPWVMEIAGKPFVCCHAKAYRTPDDPLPGDGLAWEPVPGPTQFTRDSELMNAQTAAFGRAIVALGFETKKIASAEEVRNRQPAAPQPSTSPPVETAEGNPDPPKPALKLELQELFEALELHVGRRTEGGLTWRQFSREFTLERFGKGGNLTAVEMGELVEFLRPFLPAEVELPSAGVAA
jgi:hypothetical protein